MALKDLYAIDRELGRGGMGVVYLARQRSLDRPVALKILRPDSACEEYWGRFRREASLLKDLSHANVIRAYDLDLTGQTPYIAFEYIEGSESLHEIFCQGGVPERELWKVLSGIADGLAYLHQAGIVHRDLKPGNILLCRDLTPKIIDLGLGREAKPDETRLTRDGQVLGTLSYMPPEQILGEPADHRSDIYALGLVMCELLAGRLLFCSGMEDTITPTRRLAHDALPIHEILPGRPPEVREIVDLCLKLDASARYPDMRALRKALGAVAPRFPGGLAPEVSASAAGPGEVTTGERTQRLPAGVPGAPVPGGITAPGARPPAPDREAGPGAPTRILPPPSSTSRVVWNRVAAGFFCVGFLLLAGAGFRSWREHPRHEAPPAPPSPVALAVASVIAPVPSDPDPLVDLMAKLELVRPAAIGKGISRYLDPMTRDYDLVRASRMYQASLGPLVKSSARFPEFARALTREVDSPRFSRILSRVQVIQALGDILAKLGAPVDFDADRVLPEPFRETTWMLGSTQDLAPTPLLSAGSGSWARVDGRECAVTREVHTGLVHYAVPLEFQGGEFARHPVDSFMGIRGEKRPEERTRFQILLDLEGLTLHPTEPVLVALYCGPTNRNRIILTFSGELELCFSKGDRAPSETLRAEGAPRHLTHKRAIPRSWVAGGSLAVELLILPAPGLEETDLLWFGTLHVTARGELRPPGPRRSG